MHTDVCDWHSWLIRHHHWFVSVVFPLIALNTCTQVQYFRFVCIKLYCIKDCENLLINFVYYSFHISIDVRVDISMWMSLCIFLANWNSNRRNSFTCLMDDDDDRQLIASVRPRMCSAIHPSASHPPPTMADVWPDPVCPRRNVAMVTWIVVMAGTRTAAKVSPVVWINFAVPMAWSASVLN